MRHPCRDGRTCGTDHGLGCPLCRRKRRKSVPPVRSERRRIRTSDKRKPRHTAGASASQAVFPLGMNGVYALVIGRADERLHRIPEVYRMLSTHMQIEGSLRVVAFDELEMVGYVEPRDQQEFLDTGI